MTGGMSKNGLPNNTQIELVEGCNRMCSFCGIYSIWKRKEDRIVKYMDLKLAKLLANSYGSWPGFEAKRVEFAMHGEPTLHPQHCDVVAYFRESMPAAQLQLTTNGLLLCKYGSKHVQSLFKAGLNILVVDTYTRAEEIMEVCRESGIDIHPYYGVTSINPYHYHGPTLRAIITMGNLGQVTGHRAARTIFNHGGNCNEKALLALGIPPINAPLMKKCSRPFREITVHYDGTVPVCCIDWRHECLMGKFPEDGSIDSIWNGDPFASARALLGNKQRGGLIPCSRCDYAGGFRLGLLPKVPRLTISSSMQALTCIIECNNRLRCFKHVNAELEPRDRYRNGILQFV